MNSDKYCELEMKLDEVRDALEAAIGVAREAAQMAEECDGEVGRCMSGQIEGYLIGTLKAFIGHESRDWDHQIGSVTGLVRMLQEQEREERDNEREESRC